MTRAMCSRASRDFFFSSLNISPPLSHRRDAMLALGDDHDLALQCRVRTRVRSAFLLCSSVAARSAPDREDRERDGKEDEITREDRVDHEKQTTCC